LAQLKDFLSKTPVLTTPRKKEQLLLYLTATTHVVSTVIIVERQENSHAYPVQQPVYFVSGPVKIKGTLPASAKPTLCSAHHLAEATTLLPGYSISVVTDYPLGDILRNQDATERISKWAVELGALNIDFKPRTAIKSQALVDFMAEWRENQLPTPIE
jgi:hypothetical protein